MNIDEKVITKLDNFVQILFDVRGKKEKKNSRRRIFESTCFFRIGRSPDFFSSSVINCHLASLLIVIQRGESA